MPRTVHNPDPDLLKWGFNFFDDWTVEKVKEAIEADDTELEFEESLFTDKDPDTGADTDFTLAYVVKVLPGARERRLVARSRDTRNACQRLEPDPAPRSGGRGRGCSHRLPF